MGKRISRIVFVAAAMLLGAAARGDVVHLLDGRRIEGQVMRGDGVVRVTTPEGTIEIPAREVLFVAPAAEAPVEPTPPQQRPVIGIEQIIEGLSGPGVLPEASSGGGGDLPEMDLFTPSGPPVGPVDLVDILGTLPPIVRARYRPNQATQPEPIVFYYMRVLEGVADARQAEDVRARVSRWQIAAKDRSRRAGQDRWLTPQQFAAAREGLEAKLREAALLERQLAPTYRDQGEARRARERQMRRSVGGKLREGALLWPDPPMQRFLLGVANLVSEDYAGAGRQFQMGIDAADRLAMMHQGLAMALSGQDRHLEALESFIRALHRSPDSRFLLDQARQAMQRVPGRELENPRYLAAKAFLDNYTTPVRTPGTGTASSQTIQWLAPGRAVSAREHSLPVLPYDRLVLRQAIAVPMGATTLLVDTQTVAGALEVYVQLDEGTFVPARAGRTHAPGMAGPVTILHATGVSFTPLEADARQTPADGETVAALAVGGYVEMGDAITPLIGRLEAGGASLRLPPGTPATPVLVAGGRLAGILAPRMDPYAEGGGAEAFVGLSELSSLIGQAGRGYGYAPRSDRTVEPIETQRRWFVVHAIHGERLEP